MTALLDSFSFARPLWFLAIIPIAILLYLFVQQIRSAQTWNNHIAPDLLEKLTDSSASKTHSGLYTGLVATLLIVMCTALAGPSVQGEQVKSIQSDDTLVIIMDLSISMMAEDISPSRFQRMKFKVQDVLAKRKTGHTALIVYSGDAHTVVPLTKDTSTIQHLTKSLNPWMIPSKGSRLYRAMEEANKLMKAYPSSDSRILLFTDEISDRQLEKTLSITEYPVFVVGIGSESGAPIPLPNKKLLKDNQQNIVVAKFSKEQPAELASKTSGSFRMLSVDDSDIEQALKYTPSKQQAETSLEQLSTTKDYGYLLLFPALILMLMSFRKGWLIAIAWLATPMVTATLMMPSTSWASAESTSPLANKDSVYESSFWDSLWNNQDQRAQAAYDQGHYNEAADLFSHPLRKGNAHAKAQNWESAEQEYQSVDSSMGKYNLANIQAQQGKLDEALKSYDQAIEQATSEGNQKVLDQAKKDKAFLEQLKDQQQDQQNNTDQQGESNGERGQNNDSEQNQSGNNNGDQNSSDQNSSDQKSSDSNNSDPNGSDQNNKDSSSDQSSTDEQNADASNNEQDKSGNPQNQGSSNQQGDGQSDKESGITERQAEQAANRAEQADQALDQPSANQTNVGQATDEQNDAASEISDFSQANASAASDLNPDDIEEQKYQQIMRKIQSDPSVLLENKFKIQHYQRNKPENEAQVW